MTKGPECSYGVKHKYLECVLDDVQLVSDLSVFGACDFAAWKRVESLFFTWGICIDG